MSEPELSLQQANAAAQREKIRRKLSATIVQIRREIRGTADALTGRCRYIVDRGDGPKQFKLSSLSYSRRSVSGPLWAFAAAGCIARTTGIAGVCFTAFGLMGFSG